MRTAILGSVLLALGCADGKDSGDGRCFPWRTDCGDVGSSSTLVVSGVDMDRACKHEWWDPPHLAHGTYDVVDTGRICHRDYAEYFEFSSSQVNHSLAAIMQNYQSFEVTLTTADGKSIAFDSASLENPFTQLLLVAPNSSGDATRSMALQKVVLVRSDYRAALKPFVGKTIFATLGMHASDDTGREDVGKDFAFPIDVCEGCLTACGSNHEAVDAGVCDATEDPGVGSGICIDPEC